MDIASRERSYESLLSLLTPSLPSVTGRPRLSRRALLGAASAVPVAGLLAACSGDDEPASSENGEPDQVTYLTSFGQLGRDAYPYLAQKLGYFSEAGIEVTIEPGTGTQGNAQTLLGGQAQFAAFDMSGAAIAADAGTTGFTAFAAIHQLPPVAIMAANPDIRTPADLQGRTVGIAPGTVTELLFGTWLELAGANPDEVEVVPVPPPDLVTALASEQVDAIEQFVMGQPLVANAVGGEVQVLPYSDFLTDLYGVVITTTTEIAETNPDLCIRFRDALLRGLASALENPQEAAEALAENAPETNVEVAAQELELMRSYSQPLSGPLGTIDPVRLGRSISLLQSAGAISADTTLQPEDLIEPSLVPSDEDS